MHFPIWFLFLSTTALAPAGNDNQTDEVLDRLRLSLNKLRKTLHEVSDESDGSTTQKRTTQ